MSNKIVLIVRQGPVRVQPQRRLLPPANSVPPELPPRSLWSLSAHGGQRSANVASRSKAQKETANVLVTVMIS